MTFLATYIHLREKDPEWKFQESIKYTGSISYNILMKLTSLDGSQ
jgi:hypothetical protein